MKNTLISLLFSISIATVTIFNGYCQTGLKPVLGIIYSMEKDKLLYDAGYRYLEESVYRRFSPRQVSEEQFKKSLPSLLHTQCRIIACNLFIPGQIKLVGPAVNESDVLGYVDTVTRRCREAGIGIIVLGSGQARAVPEGYDHDNAKTEFISLLRKMAGVAKKNGVIIAIENLNRTEVNFINTLAEALEVVKAVDHPNFRLTADIYHMLKEDESPASIEQAGSLLVHCHIAEEKDRARPGKGGEDFRPYFTALKKIGFHGVISMECGWNSLDEEAGPALAYLQQQLDEVFDK